MLLIMLLIDLLICIACEDLGFTFGSAPGLVWVKPRPNQAIQGPAALERATLNQRNNLYGFFDPGFKRLKVVLEPDCPYFFKDKKVCKKSLRIPNSPLWGSNMEFSVPLRRI